MIGGRGEVGVVHDLCFEPWELFGEQRETSLTAVCCDETPALDVEAAGEGFTDPRRGADDEDGGD